MMKFYHCHIEVHNSANNLDQGSKIALVRSYLRVPQAAGQVKNLIFLVKIDFFPMYANIFCDAGQVPISRYFEACRYSAFIIYKVMKYRKILIMYNAYLN